MGERRGVFFAMAGGRATEGGRRARAARGTGGGTGEGGRGKGMAGGEKRKEPNAGFSSLCDSCRIQTCNLLIRSQMLYSVELRSHLVALGYLFLESGCKDTIFFRRTKFFFDFFCGKAFKTMKTWLLKNEKNLVNACWKACICRLRGTKFHEFRQIPHRRVRILS